MGRELYDAFRIYARVLRYAAPFRFVLLLLQLSSLAAAPLALLLPVPLKVAVDNVIDEKPLPEWVQEALPDGIGDSMPTLLALCVALLITITLVASLQQLITSLLKTYVGDRLVLAFRSHLFRHVQRLSLTYHDNTGTADTIYRIQHDAPAIQSLILRSIIPTITAIFTLGSMLYVTAMLNVKLAAIATAVSPALLLLTWSFSGRLKRRWRKVKEIESSTQSAVQEVLTSVRVVKAFGREDAEHKRLTDKFQQGLVARVVAGIHEDTYNLLVSLATVCVTAVVLFVGATDVRRGAMTVGELVLVMAYLKQLYEPLKTLGQQFATKQKAMVSCERVFAVLDEQPEVEEKADARPLTRARGRLEFRGVSFAYRKGVKVLHDLTLEVKCGTRVGITGRTGSGKTTMISLLTRFYDPSDGVILLDGIDIRDYRLADLRNQYSAVLQDPVLFSCSIAENIAYGRPTATQEEIVDAAKAANAHDFIVALKQGYDTHVGERGMCLSGGERQRISLARAFLKDAPILILDEPTSSVDVGTESLIIRAMERLMQGRTTFVIAHRVATLEHCDMRIHLENGRMVAPAQAVTSAALRDLESITVQQPSEV